MDPGSSPVGSLLLTSFFFNVTVDRQTNGILVYKQALISEIQNYFKLKLSDELKRQRLGFRCQKTWVRSSTESQDFFLVVFFYFSLVWSVHNQFP